MESAAFSSWYIIEIVARILLSTFYFLLSRKSGQSLVEVLIAVALGALFVLAAATVISPALRVSDEAGRIQAGAALGNELLANTRVWAEGNWHDLLNLATSSANHYHINTSTSPFSAVSGDETVVAASTTYTRYFYVDEVFRDAGDAIVTSGGTNDPSTRKIAAVYSWPESTTSTVISTYVTRYRHRVFRQTDWSGGSGFEGPTTSTSIRFSSSSNIDHASSTGSIIIEL